MSLPPVAFFNRPVLAPIALVAIAVVTSGYARGLARYRRHGGAWPPARAAAFGWAMAALAVASVSGLARFAPDNFSAYVALYVTAGLGAPLLLSLAAPVTLLGRGRPPGRWTRWVTHPLLTWSAMTASIPVLYFTGLFGLTVRNGLVAQLTAIALVAVGFLYWYPVVAADPQRWPLSYWRRILYLLVSFPAWTIVGMALESQARPPIAGLSTGSLHLGAAVLWVAGNAACIGAVLGVFVQWLRDDLRRARRLDAENEEAAQRQLALWRAARQAAARAASSG